MKTSILFLILMFTPTLTQAITFEMGSYALQGLRKEMEDHHVLGEKNGITYAAIYDGHGGDQASLLLTTGFPLSTSSVPPLHEIILNKMSESNKIENILLQSYQDFDKDLIQYNQKINPFFIAGSTAVTVFIKKKKLYVANLGDAEAFIIKTEGNTISTQNMTKAHKVSEPSERARISKLGGRLSKERVYDKSGIGLNVTRAFGDPSFKKPLALVSNVPQITSLKLNEKHKYIILACDGLWDVMNHQQVANFILLREKLGHNLDQMAKALAHEALDLHSDDNISVVIIKIIN